MWKTHIFLPSFLPLVLAKQSKNDFALAMLFQVELQSLSNMLIPLMAFSSHVWCESDFNDRALWLSGVIRLSCVFMLTNRPHDAWPPSTAEAGARRHISQTGWVLGKSIALWSTSYQTNLATPLKCYLSLVRACLSYQSKDSASASHNWILAPGWSQGLAV